jgi:hypothetical protein
MAVSPLRLRATAAIPWAIKNMSLAYRHKRISFEVEGIFIPLGFQLLVNVLAATKLTTEHGNEQQ